MAWNQFFGGATSGAAAGGTVGGGLGALAGGALGGVSGLLGNDPEAARKKALKDYQAQMGQAQQQYQTAQGDVVGQYGDLYTPQGVSSSLGKYTAGLEGANPEQYQVSQNLGAQTSVNPLGSWKEYLDPSIAYQQESARKSVEESAAGQGGLYSGAAAREIASDTADIASQGYQTALQNARQNSLDMNAVATQNLQNQMAAGNYNSNLAQTGLANLGTSYATQQGLMDTHLGGLSDLNKTALSSQQAAANVGLQGALGSSGGSNMWGDILNATSAAKNVKSLWG